MHIFKNFPKHNAMTLCISFKDRSNDGISRAVCCSDSLITTLGAKDKGVILPSNTEIKHQTELGIKIKIVSAISNSNKENRDFVFSIAGAVDIGLRSLVQLDLDFKTFCSNLNFEEQLEMIKKTLHKFWETAYDKEIEYLLTTTDDNQTTKIFYINGGIDSEFKFKEIEPEHDLLFYVIGDGSKKARDTILCETNSLMMGNIEMYSALSIACFRMMRRAIEDGDNQFIGGNLQTCLINGKKAQYINLDDGNNLQVGAIKYPRDWNTYPRRLNKSIDKPFVLTMNINQDIYNPKKTIQEIVENLKFLE